MVKKKKHSFVNDAVDTVKVGGVSMAGYAVLGGMSSVPGMPAQASGVIPIAGAGLQLANVGQLAKTGLNVVKGFDVKKKSKKNPYGLDW